MNYFSSVKDPQIRPFCSPHLLCQNQSTTNRVNTKRKSRIKKRQDKSKSILEWERVFTSRKRTLMKKAIELANITKCSIALSIASPSGEVWFYATNEIIKSCLELGGLINKKSMEVTSDSAFSNPFMTNNMNYVTPVMMPDDNHGFSYNYSGTYPQVPGNNNEPSVYKMPTHLEQTRDTPQNKSTHLPRTNVYPFMSKPTINDNKVASSKPLSPIRNDTSTGKVLKVPPFISSSTVNQNILNKTLYSSNINDNLISQSINLKNTKALNSLESKSITTKLNNTIKLNTDRCPETNVKSSESSSSDTSSSDEESTKSTNSLRVKSITTKPNNIIKSTTDRSPETIVENSESSSSDKFSSSEDENISNKAVNSLEVKSITTKPSNTIKLIADRPPETNVETSESSSSDISSSSEDENTSNKSANSSEVKSITTKPNSTIKLTTKKSPETNVESSESSSSDTCSSNEDESSSSDSSSSEEESSTSSEEESSSSEDEPPNKNVNDAKTEIVKELPQKTAKQSTCNTVKVKISPETPQTNKNCSKTHIHFATSSSEESSASSDEEKTMTNKTHKKEEGIKTLDYSSPRDPIFDRLNSTLSSNNSTTDCNKNINMTTSDINKSYNNNTANMTEKKDLDLSKASNLNSDCNNTYLNYIPLTLREKFAQFLESEKTNHTKINKFNLNSPPKTVPVPNLNKGNRTTEISSKNSDFNKLNKNLKRPYSPKNTNKTVTVHDNKRTKYLSSGTDNKNQDFKTCLHYPIEDREKYEKLSTLIRCEFESKLSPKNITKNKQLMKFVMSKEKCKNRPLFIPALLKLDCFSDLKKKIKEAKLTSENYKMILLKSFQSCQSLHLNDAANSLTRTVKIADGKQPKNKDTNKKKTPFVNNRNYPTRNTNRGNICKSKSKETAGFTEWNNNTKISMNTQHKQAMNIPIVPVETPHPISNKQMSNSSVSNDQRKNFKSKISSEWETSGQQGLIGFPILQNSSFNHDHSRTFNNNNTMAQNGYKKVTLESQQKKYFRNSLSSPGGKVAKGQKTFFNSPAKITEMKSLTTIQHKDQYNRDKAMEPIKKYFMGNSERSAKTNELNNSAFNTTNKTLNQSSIKIKLEENIYQDQLIGSKLPYTEPTKNLQQQSTTSRSITSRKANQHKRTSTTFLRSNNRKYSLRSRNRNGL